MTVGNQSENETKAQFREYYLKLKTLFKEHQIEEFGKLKNDEERIKFVSGIIPEEHQPTVEISGYEKDGEKAKQLKESGNKAFGKSNYKEALKYYTESILLSPQGAEATGLSLTIANRSAVLYHLQDYQTAINDIDVVLSLNYPKDLRYKILERKAKCLLALQKHDEALVEFKKTITALDESKLPSERKLKMQTDIQIIMGLMTKPKGANKELNVLLPRFEPPKPGEEESKKSASLSGSKHPTYEAAIEKVEIQEETSTGRFATASGDINVGETILIEKAYCSVLLHEFSKTNCQHCFKRTVAPYPCDTCSAVIFCSPRCKDSALSTYHGYECPVLTALHQSGVSVTVLMALRIIAQQNLRYFLAVKDKLEESREEGKKYRSSDYLNVYHLVRHEKQRKREDFLERTVMALFLLRCLVKANYFQDSETGSGGKLSPDEVFIGGLLLRHLQILQFNAHEISELEIKEKKSLEDSRSVFIGGGLYATLALFNHSCDPGIVRYFEGTKVVVRAVKPIKAGEMIAENYGPIYSQVKKKERQEKLQGQYWFTCNCIPCQELWPSFEEMDKRMIRFRCDARKANGERENDCRNVLCLPTDTEEFMVKCFICGQMTNLFKGLKILQETDAMYQQGLRDLNRGNYRAALSIYLEILSTLHEVLAPPFRDYLLCQQSIRKCMLTFGNVHRKQT